MNFEVILDLFHANPPLFIGISALYGLLVGSFLNVVIYRLPIMMERSWIQSAQEILEACEQEHSEANPSEPNASSETETNLAQPSVAAPLETTEDCQKTPSTDESEGEPPPLQTSSLQQPLEHSKTEQCQTSHTENHFLSPCASSSPEAFNLIVPRSRCPKCGHLITAYENIPVISYLVQSGKCKNCKSPISIRYPLIEIVTGLLTAYLAWHFGPTFSFLAACVFTWMLLSASMIDYDHKLLPDQLTLPLMWFGLVIALKGVFVPLEAAVIGAVMGYMSLWSIFWIFKLITGKDGMGFGDFKLLAALGAWCGYESMASIIILSSFAGALVGIGLILTQGRDRSNPIPFGPYLAIAGWLYFLFGQTIDVKYWLFPTF